MKKIILIFFLVSPFCKSQNLVPNWSFETYTLCPNAGSQLPSAIPWTAPVSNSSDYYNACAPIGVLSVPNFGPGPRYYQSAKNGNAYAAIYFLNGGFGADYREYAQVKLNDSLINNKCYYAEFYINLTKGIRFATNNAAAYFSNTPFTTVGVAFPLGFPMHINRYGNPIIKDTLNWVQVAGIYEASGGEKYITIGNPKDDLNTDTMTASFIPGDYYGSYYFIDAVSVYSINPSGILPWTYRDTTVISGDSVYIGNYLGGGFTSNWYLQGGGFIKSGSGIYVKPTVTSNYIVQFTLCGVPRADTLKVTVTGGAGINELKINNEELRISPNPNNGLLTVEILNKEFILENSEIKIVNVLGEEIKRLKLFSKQQILDLSEVSNGIYFLQLLQSDKILITKKIAKQ